MLRIILLFSLLFVFNCFFFTKGETSKCQGAIQHQKLIAELIAHILRGKGIDGEADERTGDADPWRPAVVYLPLGEQGLIRVVFSWKRGRMGPSGRTPPAPGRSRPCGG